MIVSQVQEIIGAQYVLSAPLAARKRIDARLLAKRR
jgi:hypothetical protein